MDLFRFEDQTLLAEYVLAGQQHIFSDRKVQVKRSGHHYRIHIFSRKQLAVIFVCPRIVPNRSGGLLQVWLKDIAQSDASAVVQSAEMFQKVVSAAARADHAELNLLVGSLYF